jgi:hypothetical protein
MKQKNLAAVALSGVLLVSLSFLAFNSQIGETESGSKPVTGLDVPSTAPSMDQNFGPGMPTFNPEDPSTYWLAPENNPQFQGNGSPEQPFPGNNSDDSPNSNDPTNPSTAGKTDLCNATITALPADSYHQMLTEAIIKDLNLFTYVRVTWTGGADVTGIEFINGYGRNAFLLKSEVPDRAKIEISRTPDFVPESLICVANTAIKKVR